MTIAASKAAKNLLDKLLAAKKIDGYQFNALRYPSVSMVFVEVFVDSKQRVKIFNLADVVSFFYKLLPEA